MGSKNKVTRLASIDNSVLGSVTGGYGLDVWDTWGYNYLATQRCGDAVNSAASRAGYRVSGHFSPRWGTWGDDAWSAANDAANDVWNGPACSNYGWW